MTRNSKVTSLLIILFLVSTFVLKADARQFRQINPIASPINARSVLPDGAKAVKVSQAVDREQIAGAVNQLLSKWNNGELESTLSEEFFDKSRLIDAVDTVVPRDATLRVQSIQGVQTLQQYLVPSEEAEGREDLVSIVSATVRTQLEFNDPAEGYVRRQGVNEFILKVTQPAPLQ